MRYRSWGNYCHADSEPLRPAWLSELALPDGEFLARGFGRSYGDSCLLSGGSQLEMTSLNRFIAFDRRSGLLRAEAGVSLADVLAVCVPAGWFLPVTPGTKFVSLGGACANDVHGKNHLMDGSFGNWITQLSLLRSDVGELICSREQNPEWFAATIGGLGLTGVIRWLEIQLQPVASAYVEDDSIQCQSLHECLQWFAESRDSHRHRVAWLDCNARGSSLGRGIFSRANYAEVGGLQSPKKQPLSVPLTLPAQLLNRYTVSAFNAVYYRKLRAVRRQSLQHYNPFFYPLDNLLHWNRIYGSRGFLQYQCVVTRDVTAALEALLQRISQSGQASFLSVLKELGEHRSPGLLSFPRAGYTLALDFPFLSQQTLDLLNDLDAITREAGGAVYPAKDARMSASMFQFSYGAQLPGFEPYIDPRCRSDFWRRTGGAL